MVAETMKTQRRVEEFQKISGKVEGRGINRRPCDTVDETGSLFSEQPPAEWTSFLEKMCGADGVVTER